MALVVFATCKRIDSPVAIRLLVLKQPKVKLYEVYGCKKTNYTVT